jgi:cytochrome c5
MAQETMPQRVEKGKDALHEHVTKGLTSAAKKGAQET